MEYSLFRLDFRFDHDVVQARQRCREIARLLGFESQDQIRLATAASEMARNAFRYAREGRLLFSVITQPPQTFRMEISDSGPGIPNLEKILDGQYKSTSGLGMGIIGTRRLMDFFEITTESTGTRVIMEKRLPRNAAYLTSTTLKKISVEINRHDPENPFDEVQRQNQELLKTLSELRTRQEELAALNRELEDTNRGVVALYAELDERADYLKRASELKTSFLSNMSHEFRTPLNSILSLSRMLLDRMDGDLNSEQERQVGFIQRSAKELYDLVNDLLDLAKVEAGKIQVRVNDFEVAEIFGALRGMLKPLLVEHVLDLVFETPEGIPRLQTDQAKVSQILRNLISNAIKFTTRGEVRISAKMIDEGQVMFAIADTGIGIAPEDQERIFEEFTQVENSLQIGVKGTGLGLPLCRNLAELLGGKVWVESTLNQGSTFFVQIPTIYGAVSNSQELNLVQEHVRATPMTDVGKEFPVLIVEDNAETAYILSTLLDRTEFQPYITSSISHARRLLETLQPVAMTLDPMLDGQISLDFIPELRRMPQFSNLPVIVISIQDASHALAIGADAVLQKPVEREQLYRLLQEMTHHRPRKRVLLVDDNEASRYVLRQRLENPHVQVIEAVGGHAALEILSQEGIDAIFLDLAMPDMDGREVLKKIRAEEKTRGIPVVIHTSRALLPDERESLLEMAEAILPKRWMTEERGAEDLGKITAHIGLAPPLRMESNA